MTTLIGKLLQLLLGDYYTDFSLWWFFFRHTPNPTDSRPRLLLLDHVFTQDIEALQRENQQFCFIVISAFQLRNPATVFFPPEVEQYSVYNGPAMTDRRRRWRTIMDRFVARVIKRYNIIGVIAPSDNFFYVRELIPALHDQRIPYLVIDKEGTICPAYFVHFAKYIQDNCPLLADHIFVWSERQKDFWMKTGVEASRITVTGQPRSDFWRQPDRWKKKMDLGISGLRSTAPLVLFFTYDPWAYTPDYMVAQGEMHWEALRNETHGAIFELARRRPDVDVVIKVHPQQLDRAAIQAEITATGLTNIIVATGAASSNDLLVNAQVVIGFQTTALIEAMVTDTPIIYTFWGEAKDRWADDLIPFHATAGVQTVNSPSELTAAIDTALQHPDISPATRAARDAFVAEYFTTVDGHSAKRTLASIAKYLQIGMNPNKP